MVSIVVRWNTKGYFFAASRRGQFRTVAFYCSLLPCPAWYRRAVPVDNFPRRGAPGGNSHGNFLLFVTSLTRPVSLLRCSRYLGQSPPGHCGGASAPPRRRDTQVPPGYFLPNHSSLFPKKPSPFHIGLYFEEVSAVNPSVAFGASSLSQGSLFLLFLLTFSPEWAILVLIN